MCVFVSDMMQSDGRLAMKESVVYRQVRYPELLVFLHSRANGFLTRTRCTQKWSCMDRDSVCIPIIVLQKSYDLNMHDAREKPAHS